MSGRVVPDSSAEEQALWGIGFGNQRLESPKRGLRSRTTNPIATAGHFVNRGNGSVVVGWMRAFDPMTNRNHGAIEVGRPTTLNFLGWLQDWPGEQTQDKVRSSWNGDIFS